MGDKCSPEFVERLSRARHVTDGQRGLVTREQLEAAGLGRWAVKDLVAAGHLVRVLPRVWCFARTVLLPPVKRLAASLWLGDAVFSHRSAARLLGLDGDEPEIELTRPAPTRGRKGYRVHRGEVPASERCTIDGLRVTTVERTLRDLGRTAEEADLAKAVESAWRKGLIDPDRWLARQQSKKKRTPVRDRRKLALPDQLTRVLRDCSRRRVPLESALEVRYWVKSQRAGLPRPEVQVELDVGEGHPRRTDFVYRSHKLIVETQGFERHRQREVWEDDCARTLELTSNGWIVIPVTWRMLERNEARTLERIRQSLVAHPRRRQEIVLAETFMTTAAPEGWYSGAAG